MAKQRYYPIRDAHDLRKVILVPISEKVYRAIYPEIWRTQKRLQRAEQCSCPIKRFRFCDGDCMICKYYNEGNQVSFYTPVNDLPEHSIEDSSLEDKDTLDTLIDDSPSPEDVAMEHALLNALYQEFARLDPTSQYICRLFLNGKSEREIAEILGLSRSTYKRRWEKIKARLRYKLEDYI